MMRTYLGEDSDELDGFEFLIMAEAGEVGHWAILGKLNEKRRRGRRPASWSTGRCRSRSSHLSTVREGSLELAADEDPDA